MGWFVLAVVFFVGVLYVLVETVPRKFTGLTFLKNKHCYAKPNKGFVPNNLWYFCRPKAAENLFAPSGFLTGVHLLVSQQNHTIALNKHPVQTVRFDGVRLHVQTRFVSPMGVGYRVLVKNESDKSKTVRLQLKLNFQLHSPLLVVNQRSGFTFFSYEHNQVAVLFYTPAQKRIPQIYVNDLQEVAKLGHSVVLKSGQTQQIGVLLRAKLKPTLAPPIQQKPVYLNPNLFLATHIHTGMHELDDWINSVLPQRLKKEFAQFPKQNAYQTLLGHDLSDLKNLPYKKVIAWLQKKHDDARLYQYLLQAVLGVRFMGHLVVFEKNHAWVGNFTIWYRGEFIKKYNLPNSYYFSYRHIIYKNVRVLNLQSAQPAILPSVEW